VRQNHVKRQLKAGKPSIGTWLSFGSPLAIEALTSVGFDWMTIDWEHNPIGTDTMAQMLAAMRGTRSAPFVRIPEGTHQNIKRVLDAGAWGIVAPMVNTVAEAVTIARAAKHPPVGNRSFGGGRYSASFDAQRDEYNTQANDEICVVIMIESPEGINNLDAMLETCKQYGGIDACFVGPNDLLGNMGEAPAMWSDAPVFRDEGRERPDR
jgi:4-hydroxy-2-oxoheptanedioate aldolase